MSSDEANRIHTLALEYLDFQKVIDELESKCKGIKDELQGLIPVDAKELMMDGAHIAWIKGRWTEKLDPKQLRTNLVLAGIEVEIIESTFAAATSVSEGQPHLRISSKSGKKEE